MSKTSLQVSMLTIRVKLMLQMLSNRSRRIKTDQEGSGQIKGDHCDGWGCGWVSNQIKEDQGRSRRIKTDQGGSKEITVICGCE